MAKKFKGTINGISYSFSQDYTGWERNFITSLYKNSEIETQNEIARLDFLETQLQEMKSYPDALAIIEKVRNGI